MEKRCAEQKNVSAAQKEERNHGTRGTHGKKNRAAVQFFRVPWFNFVVSLEEKLAADSVVHPRERGDDFDWLGSHFFSQDAFEDRAIELINLGH
jgi:hypothetical protein